MLTLPWWAHIAYLLATTHITIAAVTIYLHRCQAHRALELEPLASHFFRFWLWLTTGMVTKEWVAVHRKHHARCEKEGDPHSPLIYGIREVLFKGTELYRRETKNNKTLDKHGAGTPNDFLERWVYSRQIYTGIALYFALDVLIFGLWGITIWAVQMMWIPFLAAGVINGVGHYWGYRNFDTSDNSHNVTRYGLLIGGEELHNNHHRYPASARLAIPSRGEFDIGWYYIRLLERLGQARVNTKRLAPN